jgi:hypothetical protein
MAEEPEPFDIAPSAGDAASSEGPEPAVKRVHVTDQLDILAELDTLRKKATMANGAAKESSLPDTRVKPPVDGSDDGATRELTSNIEKALNSDIFKNMRGMQVAVRIQDESGDTIHTLDPVSLDVDDATALRKLRLRFALDLENLR